MEHEMTRSFTYLASYNFVPQGTTNIVLKFFWDILAWSRALQYWELLPGTGLLSSYTKVLTCFKSALLEKFLCIIKYFSISDSLDTIFLSLVRQQMDLINPRLPISKCLLYFPMQTNMFNNKYWEQNAIDFTLLSYRCK